MIPRRPAVLEARRVSEGDATLRKVPLADASGFQIGVPQRLWIASLFVVMSCSFAAAEPASHVSIEWAIANSDCIVLGKVEKAERFGEHDVITVKIDRTLRGEREPNEERVTFVVKEYCSHYGKGWLDDGLPMLFFLVKNDGGREFDRLPKEFTWVLNDTHNDSMAVHLGKTSRKWPGTIDVFTRKFRYLTDPEAIVQYVDEYAETLPAGRIASHKTLDVPYGTSAYDRVWPPQYPGNAFFLTVPDVPETMLRSERQAWTITAAAVAVVVVLMAYAVRRFGKME